MKRFLIVFTVVVHLLLVDCITKELAAGYLKGAAALCVIPGFFNLSYVENRGCAWGLFQGHVWPLALFALLALAVVIWRRKEVFSYDIVPRSLCFIPPVCEVLLYAGIMGNLADRVFRGYVIDMFDFYIGSSHFPCFNLADSYICTAAALMILVSFKGASRKENDR